ncbi:hydrogenase maturation nickel metallochaperone HypA [Myxococcota bacterium]|nr:hydrogenase maturation nickel metallochaperone HypA [Myxococcota bacterium]
MHELSLAMSLVEIIEAEAARQDFHKVRSVLMEIGELSCVEVEAMRLAFEVAVRGTVAEAATLEIEITPGAARCPDCGHLAQISSHLSPCPQCGAMGLIACGGDQLQIKELEVD